MANDKSKKNGKSNGGKKGPRTPEALRDQVVLGKALRELREGTGLTQEAVAHKLEVFPTFVGRLERGERGARWHSVRKILRALEATPEDFGAAIERQEKSTPPPR